MKPKRFTTAQVRQARAGLQMTQAQFAEHLGVSLGAVRAWEQGRTSPGTVAAQRAVERAIKSVQTRTQEE